MANLIADTKHEIVPILADKGYTIAENRNYSVVEAMKEGCSHLLFIDDDMVFPEYTLDTLLEANKEIVGVNSHSRILPLSSTVGQLDENGNYKEPDKHSDWEMKMPTELFEAFFVGTGVMLIDMKVFTKIDKPWFKFEANDNGMITLGEDAWFCKKCRERGIKVWCEPTLTIGHIGSYEY